MGRKNKVMEKDIRKATEKLAKSNKNELKEIIDTVEVSNQIKNLSKNLKNLSLVVM